MVLALAASSCSRDTSRTSTPNGKPPPLAELIKVVTTIYPVTYFTQRVGGDRVQVTSLVAPGIEAHDFEPKPSDLRALQDARVVVYNHPAFETWMADALRSAGTGKTVVQAADAGVGEGAGADPHVWLDPLKAAAQVQRIRDGLVAADPSGAEAYRARAAQLMSELNSLHASFQAALSDCALKTVVISHAAFGHLARRYGIEQLGLAGISAEAEAGPQHTAEIARKMRELGIKHILVEPVLSARLAEALAAETGATLLPLHPLETLTIEEQAAGDDYFKVMVRDLESLKTALRCKQ